jgi:hypothetical protein
VALPPEVTEIAALPRHLTGLTYPNLQPRKCAREDLSSASLDDGAVGEDQTVEVESEDIGDGLVEGCAVLDEMTEDARATDARINAVDLEEQLSEKALAGGVEVEDHVRDDQRTRGGMEEYELVYLRHAPNEQLW